MYNFLLWNLAHKSYFLSMTAQVHTHCVKVLLCSMGEGVESLNPLRIQRTDGGTPSGVTG